MADYTLQVRLTPRGGRDAIEGWATGADGARYLKVRVSAPPVDGAANAALIKLIAKALGVGPGAVRIASGDHARLKRVVLAGVAPETAERAFGVPGATPAGRSAFEVLKTRRS